MKTIAEQLNIKKFPFIIKDDKGNVIYFEDSTNKWHRTEHDSKNNIIYFESSYGEIIDNRKVELKKII